jgi:hypothetical protein
MGAQVCSKGSFAACQCDSALDMASTSTDMAGAPVNKDMLSGSKRVFVTASGYTGDLKTAGAAADGLAGGDKLCATASTAALLGGTWKAWLSTDATNAIDRIADVGPWYLMDGTKVFNNKANIMTTPLVTIGRDENGMSVPSGRVWTGTSDGGGADSHGNCKGWTSLQAGDAGVTGDVMPPVGNWTAFAITGCDSSARIYCFEQ